MNLLDFLTANEPAAYLRICVAFCCVGSLIATVEYFRVLPAFGPSGLYSWPVIHFEQLRRLGIGAYHTQTAFFGSKSLVSALLWIRLLALAALPLLPFQTPAFAVAAFALCLASMIFTWRRFLGDDGSDQMMTIIFVTVALSAGLGRGSVALSLGLWFLSFQACLSYASAGIAKALSPEWRDGSAIFKVFNTEAYGLRPVAAIIHRRPVLGMVASWTVITVECVFPLVLIAPLPLMVVLLGMGLLFHVLCAAIMGLNSFLWAFAATYPALIFANHSVRSVLGLP